MDITSIASIESASDYEILPHDPPKSNESKDDDKINDTKVKEDEDECVDENCILFHNVFYFGCSSVTQPHDKTQVQQAMSIMTSSSSSGAMTSDKQIEIVLSIPRLADGCIRFLDPLSNGRNQIKKFALYSLILCTKGENHLTGCFSFVETLHNSDLFQCHVLRCQVPEAVKKVMYHYKIATSNVPSSSFTASFNNNASPMKNKTLAEDTSPEGDGYVNEDSFDFNVTLEIKEDDSKGGYQTVPWDKASSCFKLRRNLNKKVVISINQLNNIPLNIERCFGVLLTPGRNVRSSDMQLLDPVTSQPNSPVDEIRHVAGYWDASNKNFNLLNTVTQKGMRVFLSVAVDIVIEDIAEPVRFLIETKARVFPQNEKFWYFGRKVLQENFNLLLKEKKVKGLNRSSYEVKSIKSEFQQNRESNENSNKMFTNSQVDKENDDDTDEPLLSGSGEVSKHLPDELLAKWAEVLPTWRQNGGRATKKVRQLIRQGRGVPEALRCEVWQLLAGCCHGNEAMLEKYRQYITMASTQEQVIQRDIHRTFPAHDHFRAQGSEGQTSLYRICKAYSVHDQEVGYCQGLSFLAAALLLHMPEEQAFCVLVKIMTDYKMRNLFNKGFEDLHLKFYQLERAMDEMMGNLSSHFRYLGVECHMFASQWFLTLFTAKFPLNFVYQVVDIFLSEGELMIFSVAISLLKLSRQQLLTFDFEGCLKFFRVQLPKKYTSEEQTDLLIDTAVNCKISQKKLARYEKEYMQVRDVLNLGEDKTVRIERENKKLMQSNMRLEIENDDLANELNTQTNTLETQLQKIMSHAENQRVDLETAVNDLRKEREKNTELQDDFLQIKQENVKVKEMYRSDSTSLQEEIKKKNSIISDYKLIVSQLSKRIEEVQNNSQKKVAEEDNSDVTNNSGDRDDKQQQLQMKKQIEKLEIQLAQTKLQLVQSQCNTQKIQHELSSTQKQLEANKNNWFHKTFVKSKD